MGRPKQSAFFPSNANIITPSPGTRNDWSGVSGAATRFLDTGHRGPRRLLELVRTRRGEKGWMRREACRSCFGIYCFRGRRFAGIGRIYIDLWVSPDRCPTYANHLDGWCPGERVQYIFHFHLADTLWSSSSIRCPEGSGLNITSILEIHTTGTIQIHCIHVSIFGFLRAYSTQHCLPNVQPHS